MLRSILVGLDGSAYSESAVRLGIEWARQFNCLLVGLGIIDEPHIRAPAATPLGAGVYKHEAEEAHLKHARLRVEQILEHFTLTCSQAQVPHKLLEDVGMPYDRIVVEAQRYDLILLGQQTFFSFETQEGPDDTLVQLLKLAPRPVVTVPKQLAGSKSTLIAYDGGQSAARVVQLFLASGLASWRPVHVACVETDPLKAARIADRAVEYLGFHEIRATPHPVVLRSSAGEDILNQARQLEAGLLVMGASEKSTFREFLFGSVTRHMLKHATVPVFLYH